jgi:hypothetical protein
LFFGEILDIGRSANFAIAHVQVRCPRKGGLLRKSIEIDDCRIAFEEISM